MNNLLIHKRFSSAANSYREHAKIQSVIGSRLLERFDYYKLTPARVLDLGAGPGKFSHQLKNRYPKSVVVAFDLSDSMLKSIKRKWRAPIDKVVGDMSSLPFETDSFDIVFANQVIHWAGCNKTLFSEISRVLRPSGVFVFSTLGPDTFNEIKHSWQDIDNYSHINDFTDMHLLGDRLIKSGFSEPVMDMEYITLRYSSTRTMAKDLKAQGVTHTSDNARKGLMSPGLWKRFSQNYEKFRDEDNLLPLTYEVLYGQAWGKELQQSINSEGDVMIPIRNLFKK